MTNYSRNKRKRLRHISMDRRAEGSAIPATLVTASKPLDFTSTPFAIINIKNKKAAIPFKIIYLICFTVCHRSLLTTVKIAITSSGVSKCA